MSDLLSDWPAARAHARLWLAFIQGHAPPYLLRAVAQRAALGGAGDPVSELLELGEFEALELLLLDDLFISEHTAEELLAFEQLLERKRGLAISMVVAQLDSLRSLAARYRVHCDELQIRNAAWLSSGRGGALLEQIRSEIRDRESAAKQALRVQLQEHRLAAANVPDRARWIDQVEAMLEAGDLEAAEAALREGPTVDMAQDERMPRGVRRPQEAGPAQIMRWMDGLETRPPQFARYLPREDDLVAAGFLSALRAWNASPDRVSTEALLSAVARVLEAEQEPAPDQPCPAVIIRGLGEPGLHYFSDDESGAGVLLWMGANDEVPPGEGRNIKLVVGDPPLESPPRGALLDLRDVAWSLSERDERRSMLLYQIASWIPLPEAFRRISPDTSVRWVRREVEEALVGRQIVAVQGSPGMGVSTLLRFLVKDRGGVILTREDIETDLELPDHEPFIGIDDADTLDEQTLRRLARDARLLVEDLDPAPVVVFAGRPPLLRRLREVRRFNCYEWVLGPQSVPATTVHARRLLAWLHIHAESPSFYHRMAYLCAGNPTLLLFLCQALAEVLPAERPRRSLCATLEQLDEAWSSPRFQEAAWTLFVNATSYPDGWREVLFTIAQWTEPAMLAPTSDRVMSLEELNWALGDRCGRAPGLPWLEKVCAVLEDFGLLSRGAAGVSLPGNGLGLLIRTRLEREPPPGESAWMAAFQAIPAPAG